MPTKFDRVKESPEAQIRVFLGKLDPKIRKLTRSVRAAVRKRLPMTHELVYDYGRSFVIGYTPTERAIDGIVAISARADGVSLFFGQGKFLPDPKKLLRGSGRQTRFIPVEKASQLAHPDIEALIAAAVRKSGTPMPSTRRGQVVIRSTVAQKRARGKTAK